jgi:hypothetical protein
LLVKALPKGVFRYNWQFLSFRYQLHNAGNSLYASYGFTVVFNSRENPENLKLIRVRLKRGNFEYIDKNPSPFTVNEGFGVIPSGPGSYYCGLGLPPHSASLQFDGFEGFVSLVDSKASYTYQNKSSNDIGFVPRVVRRHLCDAYGFWLALLCFLSGGVFIFLGCSITDRCGRLRGWPVLGLGISFVCLGGAIELEWPNCDQGKPRANQQVFHSGDSVTQKYLKKDLTSPSFCNTITTVKGDDVANVLSGEKRVAVISALAEGSGIRQIERMTVVHRDTIMRLGVRMTQTFRSIPSRK